MVDGEKALPSVSMKTETSGWELEWPLTCLVSVTEFPSIREILKSEIQETIQNVGSS